MSAFINFGPRSLCLTFQDLLIFEQFKQEVARSRGMKSRCRRVNQQEYEEGWICTENLLAQILNLKLMIL